jgi:hypothetical protein
VKFRSRFVFTPSLLLPAIAELLGRRAHRTARHGVRALGDHLAERFGLETVFLDAPTGF